MIENYNFFQKNIVVCACSKDELHHNIPITLIQFVNNSTECFHLALDTSTSTELMGGAKSRE